MINDSNHFNVSINKFETYVFKNLKIQSKSIENCSEYL